MKHHIYNFCRFCAIAFCWSMSKSRDALQILWAVLWQSYDLQHCLMCSHQNMNFWFVLMVIYYFYFFHNKCFIDDSKTAIVHVIISQVKFLRNVLLLIIRTIQDDRVVPPEYVQLLQKCISAYSVSQRAQAQQEKVCLSIFLISSF